MTREELEGKLGSILDAHWGYSYYDHRWTFMEDDAAQALVAFIESELGVELKEK